MKLMKVAKSLNHFGKKSLIGLVGGYGLAEAPVSLCIKK